MKKVAIVTGASRGIGKAVARKLVLEGYVVVGFYKANQVTVDGVDMRRVDVTSELEVKQAIEKIAKQYGQIDVVVNNAGIDIPGYIKSYPQESWDRMVDTDLTSVFLMSKFAIPYLKKSNDGVIINVSSRIGLADYAESEFVVYGAVKAAVNNFTVGLARELKPSNIRVNAIIPTPTKTDMFNEVFTADDEAVLKAKGKLGLPEEVAALTMNVIADKSKTGELVFDQRVFL